MTIKTLTHIHKLLVEEKEKTYNAYIYIRDLSCAAYSDNKPNADYSPSRKTKHGKHTEQQIAPLMILRKRSGKP